MRHFCKNSVVQGCSNQLTLLSVVDTRRRKRAAGEHSLPQSKWLHEPVSQWSSDV